MSFPEEQNNNNLDPSSKTLASNEHHTNVFFSGAHMPQDNALDQTTISQTHGKQSATNNTANYTQDYEQDSNTELDMSIETDNQPLMDSLDTSTNALSWLFIRTMAVISAFWAGSLLVSTPASIQGRMIIGLIFIVIFYLVPRLFYHRYQKVYLNEELRTNFKPKGLIRRFIYATRVLLSGRIILLLSSLMALYLIATCSKDGILILTLAATIFTLINLFLGTKIGIKLFHAELIKNVYPFYRRWTAVLGASLGASLAAMCFLQPTVSATEALAEVGANLAQTNSTPEALLYDTLNLTAALKNYVYALSLGSPWEVLALICLVMIPYGILALNTVQGISLLSLSVKEYKFLLGSHKWVKTNQTIWRRYWKSVALPIFLIAFFATAWTLGSPYYQQYLTQEKIKTTESAQKNTFEKIGPNYLKSGTVKEINVAKAATLSRIQSSYESAANKVYETFNEEAQKLPIFINWYMSRHQKYPFTLGDNQLKAAIKTGLNLDTIYIKTKNIRKELANEVANAYTDLSVEITEILKKNTVESSLAERYPDSTTTYDERTVFFIKAANGTNINIFAQYRINEPLPNFEREILATVDETNAPWFLPILSTENENGNTSLVQESYSDNLTADALAQEAELFNNQEANSNETTTSQQIVTKPLQPSTSNNIETLDKAKLLAFLNTLIDNAADSVCESFAKGIGIKVEQNPKTFNEQNSSPTDTVFNDNYPTEDL